jgi:hypothetical protein
MPFLAAVSQTPTKLLHDGFAQEICLFQAVLKIVKIILLLGLHRVLTCEQHHRIAAEQSQENEPGDDYTEMGHVK